MSILQHQSSLIEAAPVEQEGIEPCSERKRFGPRALRDEIRVLSVPDDRLHLLHGLPYVISYLTCMEYRLQTITTISSSPPE
jgi:hypothetical protein